MHRLTGEKYFSVDISSDVWYTIVRENSKNKKSVVVYLKKWDTLLTIYASVFIWV